MCVNVCVCVCVCVCNHNLLKAVLHSNKFYLCNTLKMFLEKISLSNLQINDTFWSFAFILNLVFLII